MTADGRLVVVDQRTVVDNGRVAAHYLITADGQSYLEASPPGLPSTAQADGRIAFTDHAAYVSDDGWSWREVWHD